MNSKKSKGFTKRDEKNNNVVELSGNDESDDDVKIIDLNDSSMVPSICSSTGNSPFMGLSNCNTSQYKGKCDFDSPRQERGKGGISKESSGKFFWVSDQKVEEMRIKKKKEAKKPAPITKSYVELSEGENISSSDSGASSKSLYEEEETSCSKKINVEPEPVKAKSGVDGKRDRELTKEAMSVAKRLHQRRCKKPTKISNWKIDNDVMGTSCCPWTLSDDELSCLPEEEDVGSGVKTARDQKKDVYEDTEMGNISKKKVELSKKNVYSTPISISDERIGSGDIPASDEIEDKERDICKDTEMDHNGKSKADLYKKDMYSTPISVNKVNIGKIASATVEVRDGETNVCKDTDNCIGKRRGRPPTNQRSDPISVKKILVDSIWEKGDAQLEKLVHIEENPPVVVTLPLKFSFDDSDSEVSEKSDCDIEVEKLFEEMDYSMGVLKVGSSDAAMVDSEDNIPLSMKKDPACGCLDGGNHHLVLDEQIGLRCTRCHLVMQEIRNIIPDFNKHQGGRGEARWYDRVDYPNFDSIQIEDFTASQLPAFKHRVQAEGTVWDLVPGIRNGMYPHQQEGFEFIWKNIAGSISIEKAKKFTSNGEGLGCIISHAPGTGKTRLTIMFLQTYLQLNPDCLPLIIAPCSMLLTWEEEFRKWNVGIPFHNLNSSEYSGKESVSAVNLLKNDRQHGNDLSSMRLVKLFSWKNEKSVLGISYQLFEELANINVLVEGGKKKAKGKDNDVAGQIRKMLLKLPGVLVLDEGHIPRNRDSQIWKVLLEVKTKRRIMLSGTPFQNNFEELWNTFRVVRPKFFDDINSQNLGTCTEKSKRVKRMKEKWALLTNNIGDNDEQKLEELKNMIRDFVHVYKGTILKEKLPGLRDNVIVLSPTSLQKDLIDVVQGRNFFKRQHLQSLISVHPSLLPPEDLSEKEALLVGRYELEKLKLYPDEGVKTKFLTELIRLSWALKERVLIFGQFLKPLNFILKQLESHFNWTEGKEILFMSGENCEKQRQLSINLLNDPESKVRVMLASSRACSEGINLVGASRVVLLDVVWNPSMKKQSISRAYRLGQKKVVHVYLLIAGTWECEKYIRQAGKDRIADLIFSPKEVSDKPESLYSVAEDKILQDMVQHKSMCKIFDKILNPKEPDLVDTFGDWGCK